MRLALHAHQHLILGQFEVVHQDGFAVLPSRRQGRFVHHVRQVSAGEARCPTSQHEEINIVRQRNLAGMHPQDFFTSAYIRPAHHNPPVKPTRPE